MFARIATASVLLISGYAALAQGREGMFENADANRDGKVTRAEFMAAHAAQFMRLDRNSDGQLSKDEFVAGAAPMFDQFDADRSGALDAQELEAARTAAKERLQQRRQ